MTYPADKALGPIGIRVLFENDAVRVWAVEVEPGDKQPMHRHFLPYVIVPLTGGKIEIVSADDTIRRPQETIGAAMWREPGEIHELRNVGAALYRNVLLN